MRSGRAFQGWAEGPLTFPPTFKLKRGTDMYLGACSHRSGLFWLIMDVMLTPYSSTHWL